MKTIACSPAVDPRRAAFGLRSGSLLALLSISACGGAASTPTDGPVTDGGLIADNGPSPDAPVATPDVPPTPSGLAVLGRYRHLPSSVQLRVISTEMDRLVTPADLAFNPEAPEQLWVTSRTEPTIVVFMAPGTPEQRSSRRTNPRANGGHFLAKPIGIAFGAPGMLATAPDENQTTQPTTPGTFMGPTLWTSNLSIFDGGTRGHYDMLHNSPSSGGIAWDRDNVYWVFDGAHGAIARYDFHRTHVLGGEDHSDGEMARYAEGAVARVPEVASHLDLDHATGLLYVADTGNHRVAVLNTATGQRGAPVTPNYDGDRQYRMNDATLTTLVDGSTGELQSPSGIALQGQTLFVTDNATSRVLAYDLSGRLLDWLDLSSQVEAGALMGITFDAAGAMYLVDAVGNRLLMISPMAP